ncbi:MAG: permease-like cell division protein FtsX [Bacteroidaceae bacterium]|nr:permease-like cell division protein FtsX [Bacteroidaceae bacterium]
MSKSVIKIQTFSVYTSTTLVLLLLGAMCALLFSARALSEHIRNNMTMSVVVSAKLDDGEIEKFRTQLAKRKYVIDTQYISSAEILEEQKIELGADPVEFLGYNPYEPSIELTLKSEYTHIDSMANIEKALLKDKRVSQVLYHREIIDTVNNNINKIAIALLAFMVILTLISWSLIGNAVRLSIYSKRFLLHTMKLVGATWGFIRRPFMMHNLYIGLFSGIAANILLGIIFYLILQHEPAIITILPPVTLGIIALAVILFGIVMTTSCAYVSVTKFLRMRGDDLYFI